MSVEQASERIKRAALTRFVEVGYGSTTIDQIAAGAEVGVASIYRRWDDKAAIANELIANYLTTIEDALGEVDATTPKKRFLQLWARVWEQAERDPQLLVFAEGQVHAGFMTDELAARKEAVGERWMAAMADLGITADPATASSMIVGSLTAAWRGGLELNRDDLGNRLWAALRA